MDDVIKLDLEVLNHQLIKGDITPVVFDLLKNTYDMEGIIKYLGGKIEQSTDDSEDSCFVPKFSFSDLFESGIQVER